MVSHNESEGVQPRNMTKSHWAKGFSILKPASLHALIGECVSDVPGSQAMAGHSRIHSRTWESHIAPNEASNEPKRRRRKYGDMAVGLTHIRGVNGVMPIESQEPGTLEGVSSRTQRSEVAYAIH
jgi:hypothetical protein